MSAYKLEIVVDNSQKVLDELGIARNRALEAIGMQCENYAKMELEKPKPHASAPKGKDIVRPNVDTGVLVNSITHQVSESEECVYVGTNVEYAVYVEVGTQRTKPYPYLKPAVMDHADEYKEMAKAAMQW